MTGFNRLETEGSTKYIIENSVGARTEYVFIPSEEIGDTYLFSELGGDEIYLLAAAERPLRCYRRPKDTFSRALLAW